VTFKVLTAMLILMIFFKVKELSGLAGKRQRFGEACCPSSGSPEKGGKHEHVP
jgi:hypothetical protein